MLHWRLEGLLIIAVQYDPALYPLTALRLAEAEGPVTSGVLLAACASEEARAGTSIVEAAARNCRPVRRAQDDLAV